MTARAHAQKPEETRRIISSANAFYALELKLTGADHALHPIRAIRGNTYQRVVLHRAFARQKPLTYKVESSPNACGLMQPFSSCTFHTSVGLTATLNVCSLLIHVK